MLDCVSAPGHSTVLQTGTGIIYLKVNKDEFPYEI